MCILDALTPVDPSTGLRQFPLPLAPFPFFFFACPSSLRTRRSLLSRALAFDLVAQEHEETGGAGGGEGDTRVGERRTRVSARGENSAISRVLMHQRRRVVYPHRHPVRPTPSSAPSPPSASLPSLSPYRKSVLLSHRASRAPFLPSLSFPRLFPTIT